MNYEILETMYLISEQLYALHALAHLELIKIRLTSCSH